MRVLTAAVAVQRSRVGPFLSVLGVSKITVSAVSVGERDSYTSGASAAMSITRCGSSGTRSLACMI